MSASHGLNGSTSDGHPDHGNSADAPRAAHQPLFACIGGTAAYDLLQEGAFVAERLGTQQTPFGESQPLFLCRSNAGAFYFLSRHGETGYDLAPSFVNYRANVFALKCLGVQSIVSWSETRAINHNFQIGQYVLVDDLIDETRCRAHTFFEQQGLGRVRQWPLFCPTLRTALATTLTEEFCTYAQRGLYVCVEGPRQETAAEAHKYESFGGQLIGQSLAPEVFLAKELQMCYASVCYVASYAENGSNYRPFEAGRVLTLEMERERAAAAIERLPRLLDRLADVLQRTAGACTCERSMQSHVGSGQIGPDWRTWFEEAGAIEADVRTLPT
ncbi:MAG: MTAP family purine nucleoside phosphorylase [Phycisphaerae bacterium]|nr:MTAP family purine nucleoside phosphorylase [Phycisphaerae bacterium]